MSLQTLNYFNFLRKKGLLCPLSFSASVYTVHCSFWGGYPDTSMRSLPIRTGRCWDLCLWRSTCCSLTCSASDHCDCTSLSEMTLLCSPSSPHSQQATSAVLSECGVAESCNQSRMYTVWRGKGTASVLEELRCWLPLYLTVVHSPSPTYKSSIQQKEHFSDIKLVAWVGELLNNGVSQQQIKALELLLKESREV